MFVNLIETDQVHGHRHDVEGFHRALREIDSAVARLLAQMRGDDLLIVTADHGVDPTRAGSDHTREYAPLLAASGEMMRGRTPTDGASVRGPTRRAGAETGARRHDGPLADVGATALRWLSGRDSALAGQAFLS